MKEEVRVKKAISIPTVLCIILSTSVVAIAATILFFKQFGGGSELLPVTKFQTNLEPNIVNTPVGPGDSFSISPVITNNGTNECYVFIEVVMPTFDGANLYTYTVNSSWKEVANENGSVIFAYVASEDEMQVLSYNESTTAPIDSLTMRDISYGDYAQIDDINVNVYSYAIGIEEVSANPTECWSVCKSLDAGN